MSNEKENEAALAANKEQRTLLVANREKIAAEAMSLADKLESRFISDAGLIGGIGSFATALSAYGSNNITAAFIGSASIAVLASAHVESTFKRKFLEHASELATQEALAIQKGQSVEGLEPMSLGGYRKLKGDGYKNQLPSLFSFRSAAIGVGVGSLIGLVVFQKELPATVRKEDLEPDQYFNTIICVQGEGGVKGTCSVIELPIPLLTP